MAGAGKLQRGMQIDLKNTILFIKTRALTTGDLLFVALKFAEGNLSVDIAKNYMYRGNRGKLDDVRRGDDVPLSVSFSGKFTFMTSNFEGDGSGPEENYTVHEMLEGVEYGNVDTHGQAKFRGTRESWLNDFGCPPYCCDIEIHNNPSLECPDSEALGEAFLIRYFRVEGLPTDLSSGSCNVTGKAHVVRPITMRVAGPEGTSPGANPNFSYTSEETAEPFDDADEGGVWVADPRSLTV